LQHPAGLVSSACRSDRIGRDHHACCPLNTWLIHQFGGREESHKRLHKTKLVAWQSCIWLHPKGRCSQDMSIDRTITPDSCCRRVNVSCIVLRVPGQDTHATYFFSMSFTSLRYIIPHGFVRSARLLVGTSTPLGDLSASCCPQSEGLLHRLRARGLSE
jgi:hypothetical protein